MASPRRILIVEGEEVLGRNMLQFLRKRGHEVMLASDVAEARGLIRRVPVECLVVDLDLPDGDAAELVREASRQGICAERMVLVSSHKHPPGAPAARRAVLKPFTLGCLYSAIFDVEVVPLAEEACRPVERAGG